MDVTHNCELYKGKVTKLDEVESRNESQRVILYG